MLLSRRVCRCPQGLHTHTSAVPSLLCTHTHTHSGYLNTPVNEYKANLEAMIEKLKAKGVENILVLVPPPVRGSTAQSKAEVVSVVFGTAPVLCWVVLGGCGTCAKRPGGRTQKEASQEG